MECEKNENITNRVRDWPIFCDVHSVRSCSCYDIFLMFGFIHVGGTTLGQKYIAEALVYRLWEKTHVLKVEGSNPSTIYRIDICSHLFVGKNNVYLKRPKVNEKEVRDGPFL